MTNWKYIKRKWDELKKLLGNSCLYCGSNRDLQFAHLKKTGLSGQGRGKEQRYYDIIRNPDKYTFLCENCHKLFDDGKIQVQISVLDIQINVSQDI